MRVVGGVVLWMLATAIGIVAALWFAGAGLGWSGGFIKRGFWEDGESEFGIAFSVLLLLLWLALLGASVAVMSGGRHPLSRGRRVGTIVLATIGLIVVVTACVISIGWPEPPSEYPLPPWNRA